MFRFETLYLLSENSITLCSPVLEALLFLKCNKWHCLSFAAIRLWLRAYRRLTVTFWKLWTLWSMRIVHETSKIRYGIFVLFALEDDPVKYFVPIPIPSPPFYVHPFPIPTTIIPVPHPVPSILSPSTSRLSVSCYNFCPPPGPPHPHSLFLALRIIFLHLVFCMLFCSEERVLK